MRRAYKCLYKLFTHTHTEVLVGPIALSNLAQEFRLVCRIHCSLFILKTYLHNTFSVWEDSRELSLLQTNVVSPSLELFRLFTQPFRSTVVYPVIFTCDDAHQMRGENDPTSAVKRSKNLWEISSLTELHSEFLAPILEGFCVTLILSFQKVCCLAY